MEEGKCIRGTSNETNSLTGPLLKQTRRQIQRDVSSAKSTGYPIHDICGGNFFTAHRFGSGYWVIWFMGTEAIENRFIVVVPLYRIASGSRFILALPLPLLPRIRRKDCIERVRESEPETFLRWSIATFKKRKREKGTLVALLNENIDRIKDDPLRIRSPSKLKIFFPKKKIDDNYLLFPRSFFFNTIQVERHFSTILAITPDWIANIYDVTTLGLQLDAFQEEKWEEKQEEVVAIRWAKGSKGWKHEDESCFQQSFFEQTTWREEDSVRTFFSSKGDENLCNSNERGTPSIRYTIYVHKSRWRDIRRPYNWPIKQRIMEKQAICTVLCAK